VLDRVEFELVVVVGGIGASRNAIAVCIGNNIRPIVRPIRANVIVETNTIINVLLSLISTRKVTLARLKYFQYLFRVCDR
jgi:TctA family transporter